VNKHITSLFYNNSGFEKIITFPPKITMFKNIQSSNHYSNCGISEYVVIIYDDILQYTATYNKSLFCDMFIQNSTIYCSFIVNILICLTITIKDFVHIVILFDRFLIVRALYLIYLIIIIILL